MANGWYDDYIDAWNNNDASRVTSFMVADIIYEDVPTHRTFNGTDEIAAYLRNKKRQSSNFRFQVVDFFATGDRFASEWVMTGTHISTTAGLSWSLPASIARAVPGVARAMPGVAATAQGAPAQRSFRVRGMSIGLMVGDQVAAQRDYWNMTDLLDQLGMGSAEAV